MFAPAMELYGMSFPYNEQREPDSQAKIMSDPEYRFELIYENESFVGTVLSWENADFIYVEHFCMLPDVRGRGCGSRALEMLKARGTLSGSGAGTPTAGGGGQGCALQAAP